MSSSCAPSTLPLRFRAFQNICGLGYVHVDAEPPLGIVEATRLVDSAASWPAAADCWGVAGMLLLALLAELGHCDALGLSSRLYTSYCLAFLYGSAAVAVDSIGQPLPGGGAHGGAAGGAAAGAEVVVPMFAAGAV